MARGCWKIRSAFLLVLVICGASEVRAENHSDRKLIKRPLEALQYFQPGYTTGFFPGKVTQIENEEAASADKPEKTEAPKSEFDTKAVVAKASDEKSEPRAKLADPAPAPAGENKDAGQAAKGATVQFRGTFKPEDLLPPDQDPKLRIEADAPAPFIGMADAYQRGDRETAAKYAEQLVRYQQRFFFELREYTQLIGQALIKQKVIEDEDWDGVPQYIDYEFAKTRAETNQLFKPTHEMAMQRIKPDINGEVEIYFFLNMNCGWCRVMAPDIERLYQAVKGDRRVKIVGLLLGPTQEDILQEYRNYTGLTMPIFEGSKIAKAFGVKFAPAMVVSAANGEKRAYLKTGKQTFPRMLEFVRRAQGLPVTDEEATRYAQLKIGEIENAKVEPPKYINNWLSKEDAEAINSRFRMQEAKAVRSAAVAAPAAPIKSAKSVKMEKF